VNGATVTRLVELVDEYNRTRREAGEPVMTQRRLAELTGVAEATVSRHVNRVTSMDVQTALAYARILGCTVEDLVEDAEPVSTP
jgi:hypothetical protein